MHNADLPLRRPSFRHNLILIVGGYGSGKSEVAVNLARHLKASATESVTIADLDIVNPYFRSREAATRLAEFGVKSIVPPGAQVYADLPVVIPDIKKGIECLDGVLILDVGGDDVGARVLGSLTDAIHPGSYEMLFVLNARRPFTSDIDGSLKIMREIEASSRLSFTGIISNTHLMADTTEDIVFDGLQLAHRVAEATGLPISFVSIEQTVLANMKQKISDLPVLPLDRALVKPWERVGNTWTDRKLRIH
jgi:hypothetical protein